MSIPYKHNPRRFVFHLVGLTPTLSQVFLSLEDRTQGAV
jgi:hypothetical protein